MERTENAVCEFVDDLVVGLAGRAAGEPRLDIQDRVDQVVGLLGLKLQQSHILTNFLFFLG